MDKDNIKKQLIKIQTKEAQFHLDKIKKSFRWRLGDAIARLLERLMFVKRPKLSIEYLEEHLNTIQQLVNEETTPPYPSPVDFSIQKIQKIIFLVSDANITTSIYGDTHVAFDFKRGLEKQYKNINCHLVNHKENINFSDWDVVVSMLWDTDIPATKDKKTFFIGWIRNYPDRWVSNPNFKNYDLLLCSSQKILNYIKKYAAVPCYLFSIAANVDKFRVNEELPATRTIVFVGNKWKEKRKIEDILNHKSFQIQVYGKGWNKNEFGNSAKGIIKNTDIPKLYQNSYLILDSANATTSEWESLNSRIFNAIASKRLIITDSKEATKLFHYPIPSYSEMEDLEQCLQFYITNPKKYKKDSHFLYQELLAKHTYTQRAKTLELVLGKKLNISIKIAAKEEQKQQFGDWYFAQDLQKTLAYYQHTVRIDGYEDWYSGAAYKDDLVIVLRGLRPYKPLPEQVNFLWLISHPKEVTKEELQNYHYCFIASPYHAEHLKNQGFSNIKTLYQCTNKEKFFRNHSIKNKKETLLFVGNSRNIYRKSVRYAIELGLELHVYGSGWEQFIPKKYIKAPFVANEKLYQFYNEYDIILNDHWEDMLEYGYLSNRIFDASACGAQILSDLPNACEKLLPNIHYYKNKNSFKEKVEVMRAGQLKDLSHYYEVLNHHTFEARSMQILQQYYQFHYAKKAATAL